MKLESAGEGDITLRRLKEALTARGAEGMGGVCWENWGGVCLRGPLWKKMSPTVTA